MIVFVIALLSTLLWLSCFGLRRATINSRAMEADIKRIFEGLKE